MLLSFRDAMSVEEIMKAIFYSEHGGPEVLLYGEAPTPEIDAYEVLVRVRACLARLSD